MVMKSLNSSQVFTVFDAYFAGLQALQADGEAARPGGTAGGARRAVGGADLGTEGSREAAGEAGRPGGWGGVIPWSFRTGWMGVGTLGLGMGGRIGLGVRDGGL